MLHIAVEQPGKKIGDASLGYIVWSGDPSRFGGALRRPHPGTGRQRLRRDWYVPPARIKRLKTVRAREKARKANIKAVKAIQEAYTRWAKDNWRRRPQRIEAMTKALEYYGEVGPRKGLMRKDVTKVKRYLKRLQGSVSTKEFLKERKRKRVAERAEWRKRKREIAEEKRRQAEAYQEGLKQRQEEAAKSGESISPPPKPEITNPGDMTGDFGEAYGQWQTVKGRLDAVLGFVGKPEAEIKAAMVKNRGKFRTSLNHLIKDLKGLKEEAGNRKTFGSKKNAQVRALANHMVVEVVADGDFGTTFFKELGKILIYLETIKIDYSENAPRKGSKKPIPWEMWEDIEGSMKAFLLAGDVLGHVPERFGISVIRDTDGILQELETLQGSLQAIYQSMTPKEQRGSVGLDIKGTEEALLYLIEEAQKGRDEEDVGDAAVEVYLMLKGLKKDWVSGHFSRDWGYQLSKMATSMQKLEKMDEVMDPAEAGPAAFNYRGYRIENPSRLRMEILKRYMEGLDTIDNLFEEKGLGPLLRESLEVIEILPKTRDLGSTAAGLYYPQDRKIAMIASQNLGGLTSRTGKNWLAEVFVHEFGHHVHMHYMTKEAHEQYNKPWTDLEKDKWLGFDSFLDLYRAIQAQQEVVRQALQLPVEERGKYFNLLKDNGFDLQKTAKGLKGLELQKYLGWVLATWSTEDGDLSKPAPRVEEARIYFEEGEKEYFYYKYVDDILPGKTNYRSFKEGERSEVHRALMADPEIREEWENSRIYAEQMDEEWRAHTLETIRDGFIRKNRTFAVYDKKIIADTYQTLVGKGVESWVLPFVDKDFSEVEKTLEGRFKKKNKAEIRAIIDEWGLPTEYSKTNVLEDFAETFAFYILTPEKLVPKQLARIKEALRLSGEGGKEVFKRLASKVAALYQALLIRGVFVGGL